MDLPPKKTKNKMTENTGSASTGVGNVKNSSGASGADAGKGGTDPTKTGTSTAQPFDTKNVGDEDFAKIFDDPRLWQHPRFKSLGDRAKQADKYEAERTKAEEKKLEEQKQFQELAGKRETERDNALLDNKIIIEATKTGVVDVEAVLKLVDRGTIKKDDTGNYLGIAEAIKALLEAKPFLKGTGSGSTTVGSGTNPGGTGDGGKYKFKHSQIQDPAFYKANEIAILEALKNGQIEQDIPM